jgi:exodeoxyribonuclease VII large subunit
LPALWLEGEISNLSRPSSGHWYFSLKDEAGPAPLRHVPPAKSHDPVLSPGRLARAGAGPSEPLRATRRLSVHRRLHGRSLAKAHCASASSYSKTKLAAEGLFAIEHKRPLPRLPRRIGVVTSPTGAAIRDVLHILRRRFCTIPVLVYPVQVQGGVAAAQIARTIRRASARRNATS